MGIDEKSEDLWSRHWYKLLPLVSLFRWLDNPNHMGHFFGFCCCTCTVLWLSFYLGRMRSAAAEGRAADPPTINEPISSVLATVFSILENQLAGSWMTVITTLILLIIAGMSIWAYVDRNESSTPPEA